MVGKTRPTNAETAIARVLPGEDTVDEQMVDNAVVHINGVYVAKGLEMARAIGEYVMTTFFGDDPEVFRSRGNNHITFKELGKRDDLHVSSMFIWRAVSVVRQMRVLPGPVAETLPYTHHTLLLPLKDEETKRCLATRASEEKWPKRKLEEEVRRARKEEPRRSKAGRPPLRAFQKTLHAFEKLLNEPEAHFGELDDIDALEEIEATRLYATVVGIQEHLAELERRLSRREEKHGDGRPR